MTPGIPQTKTAEHLEQAKVGLSLKSDSTCNLVSESDEDIENAPVSSSHKIRSQATMYPEELTLSSRFNYYMAENANSEILSSGLIQSIQKILLLPAQPEDPLDNLSSQFNAVSCLNDLFPDESSLSSSKLEDASAQLVQLRAQTVGFIRGLRSELGVNLSDNKNVEGNQGSSASNGQESKDTQMSNIQEIISVGHIVSDLLLQTSRIREKSSESSHVVHEITRDIQLLDLAKRNLVTSINTLRRVSMLADGVSRLEVLVAASPRNYPEIAQTLSASKNLATLFKSSLRISRIAIILKRLQELQGELRSIMDTEFNSFFLRDSSKPRISSVVSNACLVVDVLGEDIRNHIIDHFCTLELKEYRRIFRASDEAGQLDNISRRFAYFKRLIAKYDADFARVFPIEWKVGYALCTKWNEITREDLSLALSKVSSKITVSELLDALQETTDFQAYLAQKFKMPYIDMLTQLGPVLGFGKPKPMSLSFEPHMGIFVDAQDKALSNLLTPHRGLKSRASLDDAPISIPTVDDQSIPINVLSSSTELFYFYAQNLEQCSKLSTKSMLADMFGVWQKWLRIYAEDVLMVCIKRSGILAPGISNLRPDRERRSLETRLGVNEIKQYSIVLNTADYCQVTAQELEEKVKEKIDNDFKERISLHAEKELFVSVISTAISALLKELEAVIDGPLLSLQRMPWTTLENVSGESIYVANLSQAVQDMVTVVREHVEQKKYLRNFYDKASRFTGASVLSFEDAWKFGKFNKAIMKSTSRLETLLKLVIAPVILDLKGTGRAEQNNLLDIFLTVTSTKPELESTSFLSSLDMDPGSVSGTHTIMSPAGSRVNLPNLLGNNGVVRQETGSIGGAFGALGLGSPTSEGASKSDGKKEPSRISEFRRLVSLVRRDAPT
ncbi:hypothetical protein Clacol_002658 [Clathrus columnatus]|uniref:Vps53 N-terminal domain-containing protein n=1 Tax=Clathrus columnatus TaxID=1419009 RepID=A0AAV5A4R1_9AGAM|nr:hypothetical protein Clacol_002658 [Clathrus columnatus]